MITVLLVRYNFRFCFFVAIRLEIIVEARNFLSNSYILLGLYRRGEIFHTFVCAIKLIIAILNCLILFLLGFM